MKAFKAFKAFIKPFEAPQQSVKIKIYLIFVPIQLSEMHRTGRVNIFHKELVKEFIFF